MVVGDVMSHALRLEIVEFSLEVVYLGSGTHIKSMLYK